MSTLLLFVRHSAILQALLVAGLAFAAWQGNNLYQRKVGAADVVLEINKEAEKSIDAALEARKPADVPDALARLRKLRCPEC